jgi:hypothetical protein
VGRFEVVEVSESADGAEVDVDDAVRLGQQPRGLGRRLGAEKDSQGQKDQDGGDDEECSAGASTHGDGDEPSGMSLTLRGHSVDLDRVYHAASLSRAHGGTL